MVVVQLVLDYYFQKVSIPPQDVSQDLFRVNLTAIVSDLSDPTLTSLVSAVTSAGGQALASTASASDQAALNALSGRLTSLSNNLTTLDDQILVRSQARGSVLCGVSDTMGIPMQSCMRTLVASSDAALAVPALPAGQQLCGHRERRPEPDLLLSDQRVVEPVAGLHHHWGRGGAAGSSGTH